MLLLKSHDWSDRAHNDNIEGHYVLLVLDIIKAQFFFFNFLAGN